MASSCGVPPAASSSSWASRWTGSRPRRGTGGEAGQDARPSLQQHELVVLGAAVAGHGLPRLQVLELAEVVRQHDVVAGGQVHPRGARPRRPARARPTPPDPRATGPRSGATGRRRGRARAGGRAGSAAPGSICPPRAVRSGRADGPRGASLGSSRPDHPGEPAPGGCVLFLRGLRWRRGFSVAVLAVGLISAAVAAIGPLYARAAGESTLTDELRAGGSGTGLAFTATVYAADPKGVQDAVTRIGRAAHVRRVRAADHRRVDAHHRPGRGGRGRRRRARWSARSGQCAHLVLVPGRCPRATGRAARPAGGGHDRPALAARRRAERPAGHRRPGRHRRRRPDHDGTHRGHLPPPRLHRGLLVRPAVLPAQLRARRPQRPDPRPGRGLHRPGHVPAGRAAEASRPVRRGAEARSTSTSRSCPPRCASPTCPALRRHVAAVSRTFHARPGLARRARSCAPSLPRGARRRGPRQAPGRRPPRWWSCSSCRR